MKQRRELSLREKLGQRFVVGFPGTVLTKEFLDFLAEYKIGNVILFAHNVENNEQLKKLCGQIREEIIKNTGIPPFITIDQEGGMVVRLSDEAVNVPGAMAIAATGKKENAYIAGKITGMELKSLGINFDLAPDVDVNSNPKNPVISVRSYGDTPEQVAEYALQMAKGLLEEQVLACVKHFPGHGDTAVDSHLSLPCVDKSREELDKVELYPFKKAIESGIPAVMTTHILFPQLEQEKIPATMSKTILRGLLRNEMGFDGLLLSDCMEMQAIQKFYGTENGILAALQAGVDLVFNSHSMELAKKSYELALKALESGELSEENLEESLDRILKYKELYAASGENDASQKREENRKISEQMLRDSFTFVRSKDGKIPPLGTNPFFIGPRDYRATLACNLEKKELIFPLILEEYFGGKGVESALNPTQNEIEEAVRQSKGHSSIVIGTYNANLNPGQQELIHAFADAGVPVIVVALRGPWDFETLEDGMTAIVVWEYSFRSMRAIQAMLRGEFLPKGSLPVAI